MLAKKFLILSVFLFLFLAFFSVMLPAEEGVEVMVEGYAPIGEDISKTRDEAILDAIRRGIEQVLGAYVDSSTILHNFDMIEDSIFSRSRGYVSSYSIEEEREDGNLLVLVLNMIVKEEDIHEDLEALKLAIRRRGNPRVAVVVPDVYQNGKMEKSALESEFTNILLERGFELVSRDIYSNSERLAQLRKTLEGNPQNLSQLGAWYDVTYLIIGRAVPISAGSYEGLVSYRCQADIQILQSDIGIVVSQHRGEETAVHIKEDIAYHEASRQLGEDMAKDVLSSLAKDVSSSGHTVRVEVSELSFSAISFFTKRLEAIRLTEDVYLRSFEDNTAIFDVVTSLPTYNFAETLSWWDMNITVEKVSSNTIQLIVDK